MKHPRKMPVLLAGSQTNLHELMQHVAAAYDLVTPHLLPRCGAQAGVEGEVARQGHAIAGVARRHCQLDLRARMSGLGSRGFPATDRMLCYTMDTAGEAHLAEVFRVDEQGLRVAPSQLLRVGRPHPHRHLRTWVRAVCWRNSWCAAAASHPSAVAIQQHSLSLP